MTDLDGSSQQFVDHVENINDSDQHTCDGSEQTAWSNQGKVPLLVTTVDIAPGVTVQLEFFAGQDPLDVSQRFCEQHGLPESVVMPLKEHIEENTEEAEGVPSPDESQDAQGEDSRLMDRANEAVAEVAAALESLAASKRESRPASAISSLGTEYYGRAELPVTIQRSEEAEAADASDRLYADHFRKEMMLSEQRRIQELENQLLMQQAHITETSRMLAAHRTAHGYDSYGDRLYQEGLQDFQRKEHTRQLLKAQQIEEEMAEATFHPQISKMAQSMKTRSKLLHGTDEAWNRLYNTKSSMASKKKAREDVIRKERDEQEMKECSFRPQLSKKSERIVELRRGAANLNSHERLYYLSNQQKANSEMRNKAIGLPHDATFVPEINKVSIKKAQRFNKNGPADVADRLLIRGQVYNERLEQAREDARKVELHVDPLTGQKLFHPRIHAKGPKNAREHVDPRNVGEHLYKEAIESSKRVQEYVRETQEKIDQDASKAYVNESSQKIMDRLRLDRIKAVYAYLAKTPSDCFPPESINIISIVSNEKFMDTIDPEVRADVEHAAKLAMSRHAEKQDEISDGDGSAYSLDDEQTLFITESEFIELMNEVIQRTRGYTRAYLLPMPGMRCKWEEPTFKPKLDKKSMQLANRVRPKTLPNYEILYNTAADTAAKIQMLKREIDSQKMEECTFKPVLETSEDTRPFRGRALAKAAQDNKAKHSLFHVSHIDQSTGSEANSPAMQQKVEIPGSRDQMEEKTLYEGIDAIENEIRDAIKQLASQRLTPRKNAIDLRENLNDSMDYKAILGSATSHDILPSSVDGPPARYNLQVNI